MPSQAAVGVALTKTPSAKKPARSGLFVSTADLKTAVLEKLKASKLSKDDARKLQFEPYLADEVAKELPLLPAHRAGFKIPYFDLSGKATAFYRFRHLEYGNENGFAALTASTQKKLLRYTQAPGSLNELYLPPFIDWQEYALEKDKPLIITEGELKAACATRHGWPTIGLGGVWNFRSTAKHMPLLPQFQSFYWKDRKVFIVYDSDAATNHMVVKAENSLARELMLLGAQPYICRMPQLDANAKTGVDDFIAAKGADEFKNEVLDSAIEWKTSQELCALNEEVCYVADPGLIIKFATLQRMTHRAFADLNYATRIYYEEQPTKDGVKLVEKSAAKEWIKWPARASVERVTYRPGEARIVDKELNAWSGWGTEVRDGDVSCWQALLDYIFDRRPEDRAWFEQWLAYPLQHPGEKLYSASVVWGIHQGTGKSLLGYSMFKIYGRNAAEIGDRDLYSNHNEWAENKQFVMGDEIAGGEKKRDIADRMKSMITQKQLRLNPKYVPSYTVPDCINYYFTSNHPDAFFMEDRDRRFFVHELKQKPLETSFYQNYMKWLNGDGAAHLFAHLLKLDVTGFNPQGHARETAAKADMIDSGRSDLGSWVAALRLDPDRILKMGDKALKYKLWSSTELHRIYDPTGAGRVTVNGLARELRRAGFRKAWDGAPIATIASGQQRLWIIRDEEKLLGITKQPELAKIYDDERGTDGKRKAKY